MENLVGSDTEMATTETRDSTESPEYNENPLERCVIPETTALSIDDNSDTDASDTEVHKVHRKAKNVLDSDDENIDDISGKQKIVSGEVRDVTSNVDGLNLLASETQNTESLNQVATNELLNEDTLLDESLRTENQSFSDEALIPDDDNTVENINSEHTDLQSCNSGVEADINKESVDETSPKIITHEQYEINKKHIASESQRMLRERNVALPYHKPKTRTLKEFLEKRPKFSAALPGTISTKSAAIALKMSAKELELVSRKLEEREKAVEEFYKSESDDDDGNLSKEDGSSPKTTNAICVDLLSDETTVLATDETSVVNVSRKLDFDDVEETIDGETDVPNNCNDIVDTCPMEKTLTPKELLRKIKEQVGDKVPKLSGNPSHSIDLDDCVPVTSKGVSNLMERFLQHTKSIKRQKSNVEVDVIALTGEAIQHEKLTSKTTVPLDGEDAEEVRRAVQTPGAKLKKLRSSLRTQMAQRRSDIWKEKLMDERKNLELSPTHDGKKTSAKTVFDDDEIDDDYNPDNDENALNTDSDDEEEEADMDAVEAKSKQKSAFIDDEADVSDDEELDDEEEGEENVMNVVEVNEIEDENDDDSEESLDTDVNGGVGKKKLRRIIYMNDSDDEDLELDALNTPAKSSQKTLDSTDPWEDDYLFPNAQTSESNINHTPDEQTRRASSSNLKPVFGCLTPVVQLTGLQSVTSGFLEQERQMSPFKLPVCSPSPLGNEKSSMSTSDDNLYHNVDSSLTNDKELPSQINTKLVEEICSGAFSTQVAFDVSSGTFPSQTQRESISTQDAENICSGGFAGIHTTQTDTQIHEQESTQLVLQSKNDCISLDEGDIAVEHSQTQMLTMKSTLPSLLNETDDKLISDLLDEEEMERFKKKFESPVNGLPVVGLPTQSSTVGRIVFDSTDDELVEDDNLVKAVKRKKKKSKPNRNLIAESDDDDSDVDNTSEVVSNTEYDDIENADHNVEYDSEENEVSEVRTKIKASEFFEKEAELSESDWDSADEDEKGLDAYDPEMLADENEHLDENKMRQDIERVQMRQILDEDNKQMTILKELYLEDGEFNGTGRQRQFRWKNIDDNIDFSTENKDAKETACEAGEEDVESEEQWRTQRYERDLFLKSQKQKNPDEDCSVIDTSSKIFKIGQKAIVRSMSYHSSSEKPKTKTDSPLAKPITLVNTRGSFLARRDNVLQRVAQFTKVQDSVNLNGAKKSKGFLFKTMSAEDKFNSKRKADEGTPVAIKKLRLTENFSPLQDKPKTSRAKQLFGK